MQKYREIIKVALVVLIFVFVSAASALNESLTYDEIVDVEDGIRAITRQDFSVNPYNPPLLQEISVLPLLAMRNTPTDKPLNIQWFPARMVTVFTGIMLILSVYFIVKFLLGEKTAFLSIMLLSLEPTFLAHSHLITLDTGTALFFFIFMVSIYFLMRKGSLLKYFICGITAGLSWGSRIFSLTYSLMSLVLITIFYFRPVKKILSDFRGITVFIVTASMVIWGIYFFKPEVIIVPSERTGRLSQEIKTLARKEGKIALMAAMDFLETQPVPLGNYLALIKNNILRNWLTEPVFFLGKFTAEHKIYYMAVTLIYKFPLPFILLFIGGSWIAFKEKNRKPDVLFFVLAALAIIMAASLLNMDPQIRYVLPSIPFMAVAGGVAVDRLLKSGKGYVIAALLGIWYVFPLFSYFPHYITYANFLAGGRDEIYLKFKDSNLDWGQGLVTFKKYVDIKKPGKISFSYFGRDDASLYGFNSDLPYGSYKKDEICRFHDVEFDKYNGPAFTAVSVSNWYDCGYYLKQLYSREKVKNVVGDSILIFNNSE